MNTNDIKLLFEKEGEVMFLKKKSELGFLDIFYTNNVILDFVLFFRKTKYDCVILFKKRIILINQNKLIKEFFYDIKKGIKFNSLIPEIVFFDGKGKTNTTNI
tara:strand:- start:177 stop:485 length:309 start_codon:yes stop_codon:yes gene_type:complete